MSSRQSILNAIKTAKPSGNPLPEIPVFEQNTNDLVGQYQQSLEKNGGKFVSYSSVEGINAYIKEQFSGATNICSLVDGVHGNRIISATDDPHTLYDMDVAIINGFLGVAENAAVWFPDEHLPQRALPFITQHLIAVLRKQDIVPTMHDAYKRIQLSDISYGIFIAGPSKTADIEQSLVIGAHGARSLAVLVL